MSRRGSAVNSQAGGTTSATVRSTYSGISGVAAGDIFVGILSTNSGTVTLNSLLGGGTAGHDWSAGVLSPAGALPKAGDSQASNIESWLVVRKLTAQDITDGFVTATLSASGRCSFTAAVYTGGAGTWQTPPAVAKATASTVTGPSLTTAGTNSDVVSLAGARNAALSTFPVISLGTGFTTDNTDGTANASSANLGGATGHLTTLVGSGVSVGGQSISATNTPTQLIAYLVELDPISSLPATATGSLSLAGTAGASGVDTSTGTLALAGTAGGVAGGVAAGVVALAGTGGAGSTGGATGALVLAGAGAGQAVAAGSGTLTLTGAATGRATGTASGALTLAGAGSGVAVIAAAGTILLGGVANMSTTATGTITLAGTATASAAITAAGSLTLGGSAPGQDSSTATGTLALTATAAGRAAGLATATIALTGTAAAGSTATAIGILTLTAIAAGRAAAAAAGALLLAGTATATTPGGTVPFDGKTGHPRTAWTTGRPTAYLPADIMPVTAWRAGRPRIYPNPRSPRDRWTAGRTLARSGPHAP